MKYVVSETNKPSKAWYILPILLTIIGGIIMLIALRNRDSKMAIKGFIVGIISLIVSIVISIAQYAVFL